MYAQIFGEKTAKTEETKEDERIDANDIVCSNMSIFEENEEYKDQIDRKSVV